MGVIMYNGVQYTGAGSGDGGGDVEDVYVNGTSVLDSNKIAQVKSYMELTESQYNALPASKLSDDVLYCISDIDYEDRHYFNPIIYSTEEREVGVWIDNKPLYQRTYPISSTVINNDGGADITSYVDNFSEMENIIDCLANNIININAGISGVRIWLGYTNRNKLKAYCGEQTTANYITIWYTKTTDTPGSGSYNTLGVPNVHYSTDEQVIGTWIDGRPIYMKCFQLSNYQLVRSAWTIIDDVEVPNIDDVVEITVSGYDTDNQYPALGGLLSIRFNGDKLQYFLNIDFPIYVKTIILRYTKTTD